MKSSFAKTLFPIIFILFLFISTPLKTFAFNLFSKPSTSNFKTGHSIKSFISPNSEKLPEDNLGAINYNLNLNFGSNSSTLANKYLPMKIGDKLTYKSYGFPTTIYLYIEAVKKEIIDTVSCLKVYSSGIMSYFWLAEDTSGNIWVLKQYDEEFDETEYFGRNNAKLVMPKEVAAGTFLWQNHDPMEEVIDTNASLPKLSTGLGPFPSCLMTRADWGDGDIDMNYYAPDIGYVKVIFNDEGGINGIELISISCSNECSSGQTRCNGDFVQICGNYDGGSCLEWPSSTSGSGNQYCEYGCLKGRCITSQRKSMPWMPLLLE